MPAAPVPPSMSTRSTAIVIDAGSSGSRAHLYTFGAPQLTTIREEWSMKRWPGLSACALKEPNAPSAGVNISGCAKKNLSHMLHDLEAGCRAKSVHCAGAPVYLRATAGLRLLQPKERESILQGAAEAIRQSAFRLASLPRTLPGSEEALYDWLMVNAAAHTLGAPRGGTYAVLDLGGGSTQIAFEPASTPPSSEGMQQLGAPLGGRALYAVSRLGLGMNEAHAGVLARWRGAARHPCTLPGDYEGCRKEVSAFVRAAEEEGNTGLGRQPRTPPLPPAVRLVGLDNFYFAVLALWGGEASRAPTDAATAAGLADAAGRLPPAPTVAQIEARARRLCALSEEALRLELGGASRDKKLKAEKLPKACTCAALIVVLAREVYGVADEQRIAVAADIHGFDGSWALGAMVYEIAQGSGQYGLVGAGGIVVAGALLVGLLVSGLRRAGWARRLSTYVRLY